MYATSIWNGDWSLEQLHVLTSNTLVDYLGIEFIAIAPDALTARLPVHSHTSQRMGFLHGGASLALAETVGSIASQMCVAPGFASMGVEINANHVRPVPQGQSVTATARALHLGRQSHVWSVTIDNEAGKLVCVARLTTTVQPRATR